MAHNSQNLRECHDELINSSRDKIFEIAVPNYTHMPDGEQHPVQSSRQFFPTKALRDIFTLEYIKAILDHKCEQCSRHMIKNPQARPVAQTAAKRIASTDSTINLFALLVILRYPLLIGCFLSLYDDKNMPLPRYFSAYDLRDLQFKHLLPSRSKEQLVSEFQDKKWQFSTPIFSDDNFQSYQEGTILPYIDETPIGRGGYGTVIKVAIHPLYCSLGAKKTSSNHRNQLLPKEFARKEIIGHDAIEFVKEKTNLEWIATLQHPNLVQIQKTYQLGDKFNILFPLARTNLHEYLRFRKWGAPQGQLILTNPLWVQVVGITEALSNIIDFTDPKDPNHVIFGYHLDLKPTNILVDRSTNASEDVFKISDFGQTQFIDSAFAGTTKVVGGGAGTDAYAPPEYYEDKQDRKYDVWSLGIIFLEILAFAVRGSAGLRNPEGTGLDQVRETRENGKVNSRFYIGRGSRAALKPSISTWIEHLKRHPLIADSDSQRFTRSMLALISSMLDPNMETRHSIAKVLIDLRKILNVVAPDPKEKLPEPSKNETFLVNERQINYYPQLGGHPIQCSFTIFEDNTTRLRTFVGSDICNANIYREEIKLITTFQHTKSIDMFEFQFLSTTSKEVSLHNKSFSVNNLGKAKRLQSALTNQDTSDRYPLGGIKIKQYQPVYKKLAGTANNIITRLFHSTTQRRDSSVFMPTAAPYWIELWLEKPQVTTDQTPDVTDMTRTTGTGPRFNRRINPARSVPLGRVMIFCDDRIIVIPFAKECQLEKRDDRIISSSIKFKPMDPRQQEYFTVSYITPSEDETNPAIPMHLASLRNVENDGKVLCESVEVKFEKWEDAKSFYGLYKNEKARWLHAIKGELPLTASMLYNS